MDCRVSKYETNFEILILSWYFDIIMIFYWYYQMVFDISFINHIMVIFWYYHDILIFNNKAMMVAEYQNIKSTVRFWEFDIIMIFWYFQIIFDTSSVCHLAVIFCYCRDILRFKIKTIIITNVCCCLLPGPGYPAFSEDKLPRIYNSESHGLSDMQQFSLWMTASTDLQYSDFNN